MFPYSCLDWWDVRSTLLFLAAFFLLFDFLKNRNPPNYPPGPWGLPFIGNIFTGFSHHALQKVAQKYGDICSLRWGGNRVVLVSGYRLVKDILVTQGDNFLDRPKFPLFNEIFKECSISLTSGYRWRKQRQFSLAHLKNFGEGKRTLELHIQQECRFLCEAIQEQQGGAFNPHVIINNAVANVIGALVFGKRFEYDDTNFQNLLRLSQESILLFGNPIVQMYDVFPWLVRHLPGPHVTIFSNYNKLISFLRCEIEKHKRDWDPFHHRDYVDTYIAEIDKRKKDPEAGFNGDTLAYYALDLFEAGTETMTNTLRWALLFMIKYPDVQEEVHAEIEQVIGQSRQPSLANRPSMPYTEAVIHEVQRRSNIVPLNFPRVANKDTVIGGYLIPKGTMVFTDLSSVLNDKSKWESVDSFHPQHFLDENGHFRKNEAFYPFGAGKRGCLGEQLARTELFLFLTSLLQRFALSSPPGVEPSLEAQGTAVLSPKPFQICVAAR